jgi:hypothetical protein
LVRERERERERDGRENTEMYKDDEYKRRSEKDTLM